MNIKDYTERKIRTKKGKMVDAKIVKGASGAEYGIGPQLGEGGFATVYKCQRLSDGKMFAIKVYEAQNDIEKMRAQREIKKTVQGLIERPLTDENGKMLKEFVSPLDMVELPYSKSFAYIMELVDTKSYKSFNKLWTNETYPDALAMCHIVKNLADFFDILHHRGLCYKDINEGNIYIESKTGDVRIIDCDNIRPENVKTVLGTPFYIAPEVYNTTMPNRKSDYYSMAVYLYRLMIGNYPLLGKKTKEYLMRTGQTMFEAQPIIFGEKMALFCFDPNDSSNTIRGLKDKDQPGLYEMQVKKWETLTPAFRECFIRTFSTGLKGADSTKRARNSTWRDAAEEVEKNGIAKCPKCGKHYFANPEVKECMYCGKGLNTKQFWKKDYWDHVLEKIKGTGTSMGNPAAGNAATHELQSVEFAVLRDVKPENLTVTAKRKADFKGSLLHPSLSDESIMRIEYNKVRNVLGAVNTGSFKWIVSENGVRRDCMPGERVVLKAGIKLTLIYRKLQLTVKSIR